MRPLNVYVVEIWSNSQCTVDASGHKSHDVFAVHYASSYKKAKKWCEQNKDFGGTKGMIDFYPWHWRVSRHLVNEDETNVVHNHYKCMAILNPNGSDY